jgi:hypothetical protein
MNVIQTRWIDPHLRNNIAFLERHHPERLTGLAEVDALAVRVVTRRAAGAGIGRDDELLALALLRRSNMLFAAARQLLASSQADGAKLIVRALFELLLQTKYFIFGTSRVLSARTVSPQRSRETRARYYMAADVRSEIYVRLRMLGNAFGRVRKGRAMRRELQEEIDERLAFLSRQYPNQMKRMGAVGKKPNLHHDRFEWYAYGFRSPEKASSIFGLALRLGWRTEYHAFYGPLSGAVHPKGLRQDVERDQVAAWFLSPYSTDSFELLVGWACRFQLMTLRLLAFAYCVESMEDIARTERTVLQQVRPSSGTFPNTWF